MDSLKFLAMVPVLLLMAGCGSIVPPKYDTHETYDAKIEQWRVDYWKWRDTRHARYETWRDEFLDPALESVSDEQWHEHELDVHRKCGRKPSRSSKDSAYDRCKETLLNQLLVENFGAFETFDTYLERQGGEEPEPERPTYNLKPSPPSQFDIANEKAERACSDAGGQWIRVLHADAWDWYSDRMRCLKERPSFNDPARTRDKSLLPYEIWIRYDRRSQVILDFRRLRWEPGRPFTGVIGAGEEWVEEDTAIP